MSPAKSDEPLRKVTMNFYEADCKLLESTYGFGWTEQVRQMIHQRVTQFATYQQHKRTLGELE